MKFEPTHLYNEDMNEIVGYVGRGGRVTLPAEHRRALGIAEGDEVVIGLSGGSIRIQTRRGALSRARAVLKRHERDVRGSEGTVPEETG